LTQSEKGQRRREVAFTQKSRTTGELPEQLEEVDSEAPRGKRDGAGMT